jgi:hypothetical protein
MSESAVSLVTGTERERAIATLVSAFVADPAERWLYPNPQQYLAQLSPVCRSVRRTRLRRKRTLSNERTFMLFDRTKPPDLTTDLAGMTPITFAPHSDGNLRAALGSPCTEIRQMIDKLGARMRHVASGDAE